MLIGRWKLLRARTPARLKCTRCMGFTTPISGEQLFYNFPVLNDFEGAIAGGDQVLVVIDAELVVNRGGKILDRERVGVGLAAGRIRGAVNRAAFDTAAR